MSNNANVAAAIKEVAHKVFGGYAELLRMPHTARFSIGSVIACMPFPMVGMTITISVQHYYGNYSLAGVLTAIQAIALAVSSPLLGKLVDKFGQRQVSIPTIIVWIIAAISLVSCITARVPSWILFCIVPFMAAIPPWGAMSRQRWTTLLKGDTEKTNRALSLSGVLDHIAQRGCGKNEPRAVPIRRIRRMHVGDRQSTGIHLGRNFRSAGVLIHRHVRGDRCADVPDRADH